MGVFDFLKSAKPPAMEAKAHPAGALLYNGLPKASWMQRQYRNYALEAYIKNAVAARCINSIASAVASVPMYMVNGKGDMVTNPMVEKLLAQPNPMQSYYDFISAFTTYYLLAGNSWVMKSAAEAGSRPLELWLAQPDAMSVNMSVTGMPSAYVFDNGRGKKIFPVDAAGRSDVMHMYRFHPLNQAEGLSFVDSGANAIDVFNQISTWNMATLQNDARPAGALKVEGELTDEQYARRKQEIEQQWGGGRNAGKPILLENGMTWQQMGLSPKELDFLANKADVAREICLAFGVPALLLGLPGDNTYANYAEARIALYEETVLPLCNKIAEAFSKWLLPQYGLAPDIRLVFDFDKISALQDKRWTAFEKLKNVDYLTINEKRELAGFGPIADGDVLLVSMALGTLEDVVSPPVDAAMSRVKSIKSLDDGY